MSDQKLRRRRTTAIKMLKASAELLDVLIAQDPRPAQDLLSRKITGLNVAWDDFGKAHEALFSQVAEDKVVTELAVLHAQTKIYDEALERAMVFEETYGEPVAVIPTLEVKVEDLLQRRTAFYARAEEKVDRILGVLEDTVTPLTPASLRAQLLMLDEVKDDLEVAMTRTSDMIELAGGRTVKFRTQGDSSDQVVQRKIQQARTRAGELGASSVQQTGAEDEKHGENPGFPQSSQFLYEKRPFPHFYGQKRNYPSIRREWTETVTKAKFPADIELQEIKRCTPKVIQPDIKNLKKVSDVWEFLNLEYGQLMELTSELVNSLTSFQYFKEAKTEDAKFAKLWRI